MLQGHPLFVELEATLTQGTSPQRFTILRKITDLFLVGADTYSDEHISLFDDLISRLIEKIERQALVELSGKLAAVSSLVFWIAQTAATTPACALLIC